MIVRVPGNAIPPVLNLCWRDHRSCSTSVFTSTPQRSSRTRRPGCPGRSGTVAKRFLATFDEPQGDRVGETMPEVVHAARAARLLADTDADVIHDHSTAGPLSAGSRSVPTVVTAHNPVTGEHGDYYRALGGTGAPVAIPHALPAAAPDLAWAATVHNAVRVDTYPFSADKGDYALFLGRASADKGVHLALDAAREAGVRLLLAGKCSEPGERAYFDAEIAPRLGDDAVWLGEADHLRKRELLAGARCLVAPVRWEEPFGLVLVEALACGTPVVAFPRGAVPEIVRDGVTGFVCEDVDGLARAIVDAGRLDPAACRADAKTRFDVPAMAAGYESVYAAVR